MARIRSKSGKAQPLGLVGKVIGTLFLGAFLVGGVFFFGMVGKSVWQIARTHFWESTEGRILESEVAQREGRYERPYRFRVVYEYEWEGTRHTSEESGLNNTAFGDYAKAEAMKERFPVDAEVSCYVNPDNPSEAVLVQDHFWYAFALLIPAVFILIGGGGILILWFGKWTGGRGGAKTRGHGPASARAVKGGAGCLVFFFLIFLLAGLGFFYIFFLRPVWMIQQAKSWEEVPCVVESSQVRRHRSDDGYTYSIDILYRYEYGGQERRSSRYSFVGGSTGGRANKQEIVRQHPPGHETVCYVNPSNPAEAVLNRDFTASMWIGLLPLLFVAVGAGGIAFTVRGARRRRRQVEEVTRTAGVQPVRRPTPAAAREMPQTGPVELKVRTSPWGKLIAMILFALFWNGIVSVFLWRAIKAWQESDSGFMEKWFLPIFLIPFVLIGLFLIGAVIHSALALFNPRPRLRLSSGQVKPGQKLDVEWEIRGRIHVLQRLSIYLEGQEVATYRRGTRSRTDKSAFARIPIINTTHRPAFRRGRAQLEIPEATMPTFEATHNQILWTLHVRGEIARWPDVEDEFAVRVLPRPAKP